MKGEKDHNISSPLKFTCKNSQNVNISMSSIKPVSLEKRFKIRPTSDTQQCTIQSLVSKITDWVCVKEEDWCPQDRVEHSIVQYSCRP